MMTSALPRAGSGQPGGMFPSSASNSFSRDSIGVPSSSSAGPSSRRLEDTPSSSLAALRTPQRQLGTGALRARKSNAPDIGTPIHVASTSPYRTPESTSKASFLLSRTPFGTPKRPRPSTTTASTSSSTSAQDAVPKQPLKPVTGAKPQIWPLCKSVLDSTAYTTFALQPRPYLSYSGMLALARRITWTRLVVVTLLVHHALFCSALFQPTRPLHLVTVPIRPLAVVLSTMNVLVLFGLLLLLPGQPFSLYGSSWNVARHTGLVEERFAGFRLAPGSPISVVVRNLRQPALWRGVLLHAAFSLSFATAHAFALIGYASDDALTHSWSPYHSVPVRLSQGYKTTAVRPNERFWFLLLSNTIVGGSFALIRALTLSRPAIAGAAAPAPFAPPRFHAQAGFEPSVNLLLARVQQAIARTAVFGVAIPASVLQAYLLVRRPFFRLVLSIIGQRSPLRPLLIPSLRQSLVSADLLYRTSMLGVATVVMLELLSLAWEVLAAQPINLSTGGLSKYSREATKCLIRGMQSRRVPLPEETQLGPVERDVCAHFAFAEMASVVTTDPQRRKAIFQDVGQASSGALVQGNASAEALAVTRSGWAAVAYECMAVLQENRAWLKTRGQAPKDEAKSSQADKSTSQKGTLRANEASHQMPIVSGQTGTKPVQASIWDKLSSSSLVPSAVKPKSTTSAASSSTTTTFTSSNAEEGLGSLLHRIAAVPTQSSASTPSTGSTSTTSTANKGANESPAPSTTTPLEMFATLVTSILQTIPAGFALLPKDLQHVIRNSFVAQRLLRLQTWFLSPSDGALLRMGAVPHDEALAIWSVQILGALLAASVEQDGYGTVALARSARLGIDDVLEECAGLLLDLQKWAKGLADSEGQQDAPTSIRHGDLEAFDREVTPLIVALRTTLTTVQAAFEPTGYRVRPSCRTAIDEAMAIQPALEMTQTNRNA